MFYLELAFILIATTALASWCGWGLAQLTLPVALAPYRHWLAPLLGYALVVLAGYWAVRTSLGLNVALPLIVLATGALNLLALRVARGQGSGVGGRGSGVGGQAIDESQPSTLNSQRSTLHSQLSTLNSQPSTLHSQLSTLHSQLSTLHSQLTNLALPLLLVLSLLVNLAPLLHYGHVGVIGGGWDIETALGVVRYLERGPVSAIASNLPNPLRDSVSDPPRIGKTLGFAAWQGSVDVLLGAEALATFTPLLAWLRTLGVLAVYLLCRVTFGLGRWPALFAAAATSAGALLLWTTYFNFEKQLAAWPLIPLGVLLGVAAVEDLAARGWRAWPVAFGAALVVAAMPVAYYPALTVWGPLSAGVGLALLWHARARLRLLAATLALGALTLLLGLPTVIDYLLGFSYRYSTEMTSLGVFRYITAAEILGFAPYLLQPDRPPLTLAIGVGLALSAALALIGLLGGPHRARLLGALAGILLYLAWLRWSREYPYAFMKGAAYAAFVAFLLVAAGAQALATQRWFFQPQRTQRTQRPGDSSSETSVPSVANHAGMRWLSVGMALLILALLGASQGQVVAAHWQQPGLYAGELPALLELRRQVPPGSSVTISDDRRLRGPVTGLAVYLLDQARLLGSMRTAYTAWQNGAPGEVGEYGLLHVAEDPEPWGYRERIWAGGSFALYRRPRDLLARLRVERILDPGEQFQLSLGASSLALDDKPQPGATSRSVALAVATINPATLSIGQQSFALPAGGSLLRLGNLATPQVLALRNGSSSPIALRYVSLGPANSAATTLESLPATMVAYSSAEATTSTVTTTVQLRMPDSGPLTLALDIWDEPNGIHYGWYGAQLGPQEGIQQFTLALDLRSGAMRGTRSDGTPLALGAQFIGLQPGSYAARLHVAAGGRSLVEPAGVFAFRVAADGSISRASPRSPVLLATATNRPAIPLDAQLGDDTLLHGYYLAQPTAQPGTPLNFVLWWQAQRAIGETRGVMVHLLDASGTQVALGDGPPGGGAPPTEQWRAGQVVIDARSLALPPQLPPGNYTLLVAMYRWPSLERLPLLVAGTRQPDDAVRIPVTVAATP